MNPNDVAIASMVLLGLFVRKVALSMTVHWASHFVDNSFSTLFGRSERKEVIHSHFLERAKGNGHNTKDVTHCPESSCALLSATV